MVDKKEWKKQVLELLKLRLGIKSDKRDKTLEAIIESIIHEFENVKGYQIEYDNYFEIMLIVDYADWRYSNRGESGAMPRHLQYRLHNLELSKRADVDG